MTVTRSKPALSTARTRFARLSKRASSGTPGSLKLGEWYPKKGFIASNAPAHVQADCGNRALRRPFVRSLADLFPSHDPTRPGAAAARLAKRVLDLREQLVRTGSLLGPTGQ